MFGGLYGLWNYFLGVILAQSNRILTIQRVKKEDSGIYMCTACNKQGCDSSQAQLTVEGNFFCCYCMYTVSSRLQTPY